LKKSSTGCREHDVVDVEQEVEGVVAVPIYEQGRVRLGLDEAEGGQVGGKATAPGPRRLLEPVQGAIQPTNQIRASEVDVAGGLAAVDRLCQSVMEEGILDIELMDPPVTGEGEGEDDPKGGELDDRVEDLVVVHSGTLGEAPKDPTSLVEVERAIRGELVAEKPLVGNHVGAWWTWHRSQVWLVSKTVYSFIVRRQWGSARAAWTEEGTEEAFRGASAIRTSRLMGQRTPAEWRVTIG
jgi:hypothetical protein